MLLGTALMCMATNIYHEAKHEPLVGRIAVAQVVMNRVEAVSYTHLTLPTSDLV